MAIVAACTDKGVKRSVNQDACCVKVAHTHLGEILMAVVCDGVGGLSAGELASATVTYRFAQWFNEELPTLLLGMSAEAPFDFDTIQTVWGILLTNLNETIQAHARANRLTMGTTFTGMLFVNGRYLVAHVGDCRAYCLGSRGLHQITEDQTLLAKKLREGAITPQEASSFKRKHVILQSVGTEGILRPTYYTGAYTASDLFVLCSDGAYRKAEERGIDSFFADVDVANEDALFRACRSVVAYDIEHGEKDNLTVVAVRADEQGVHVQDDSEDLPTMVEGDDEEDLPTMVEGDES